MTASSRPLLALTAADLMSPTVMTIPRDMSLRQAAHLLAQADISGAPVTNAEGHCVGVISARDFVSWAERGESAARKGGDRAECVCSAWQIWPPAGSFATSSTFPPPF
jgi:CBS domain-containing protein